MKILVINNRDSFVYNLVRLLDESHFRPELNVCSCDSIPDFAGYDGIVISPGPGIPSEYPGLHHVLEYCGDIPVLGVCLGFQAIVEHFGGRLCRIPSPLHGHRSILTVTDMDDPVMGTLPEGPAAGRYHSWKADARYFPGSLAITSVDEDGNIMSLRHRTRPIYGVQFHPESYISDCGREIADRWLSLIYCQMRQKRSSE